MNEKLTKKIEWLNTQKEEYKKKAFELSKKLTIKKESGADQNSQEYITLKLNAIFHMEISELMSYRASEAIELKKAIEQQVNGDLNTGAFTMLGEIKGDMIKDTLEKRNADVNEKHPWITPIINGLKKNLDDVIKDENFNIIKE